MRTIYSDNILTILWRYYSGPLLIFLLVHTNPPPSQAARELLSSYSVSPGQLDSLSNLLWGPPPPYEGAPSTSPTSPPPPPASSSSPVNTANVPAPARTSRSAKIILHQLDISLKPGPACWSRSHPPLKSRMTAPWTPGVTSTSGWAEGRAACQQGGDQHLTSSPPSP